MDRVTEHAIQLASNLGIQNISRPPPLKNATTFSAAIQDIFGASLERSRARCGARTTWTLQSRCYGVVPFVNVQCCPGKSFFALQRLHQRCFIHHRARDVLIKKMK